MSSTTASSNNNLIIAFFGATGGCTNACLAYTLNAGYQAVALARTPSKLTDSLLKQDGITEAMLSSQLRIVQGDATDISAVKKTLLVPRQDGSAPHLVQLIVSGIGGTASLRKDSLIPRFTLDNPHITEQTTQTLLSALREIYLTSTQPIPPSSKPLLTAISTTGVTADTASEPSDVPCLIRAMYHTILALPHEDKRKMEELILAPENKILFSGTVIVRPTFLKGDGRVTAGTKKGWDRLRVGTSEKPAVGYTIDRAHVGQWIFAEVIHQQQDGREKWVGKKVTLTS